MTFGAIVTDFSLLEHLSYQIPANKVFWDRRGKPKKPVLPFDKVVQKSPAWVQSKKTWAHKFCVQSDKPSAKASASAVPISQSSTRPQARCGVSSASAAEANPLSLKRKADKGKAVVDESLKKARMERSQQLLSLAKSTSTCFASATFEKPRSPVISPQPPQNDGVALLEVTHLRIRTLVTDAMDFESWATQEEVPVADIPDIPIPKVSSPSSFPYRARESGTRVQRTTS